MPLLQVFVENKFVNQLYIQQQQQQNPKQLSFGFLNYLKALPFTFSSAVLVVLELVSLQNQFFDGIYSSLFQDVFCFPQFGREFYLHQLRSF